jgi:hypothetical protein
MNPSDLATEYGNIKAYCRKEAAKSFKHPLAPAEPAAPEETAEGEKAAADLSDDELDEMLREG